MRASLGLPRGFLGVFLELLFVTSLMVFAVDLLFLLLFLSLLARLRIPLMEEDLGCTFFNFIDFVVVAVQVNFIKKVSFIYHLVKLLENKFYMKLLINSWHRNHQKIVIYEILSYKKKLFHFLLYQKYRKSLQTVFSAIYKTL